MKKLEKELKGSGKHDVSVFIEDMSFAMSHLEFSYISIFDSVGHVCDCRMINTKPRFRSIMTGHWP